MDTSSITSTTRPAVAPAPAAGPATGRRRARLRLLAIGVGLLAIVAVLLGVQAFAANHQGSTDGGLHFVIPAGASNDLAVPTIDSAIEIPTRIVFRDGEAAILTIRNDDSVANRAGPWVIGPGQTYTARFDQPGTYDYACTVDPRESVTVIVEGKP